MKPFTSNKSQLLATDFPEKLKNALARPLPGSASQNKMAPEGRHRKSFEKRYSAAVLIALFQDDNRWRFPLIQRAEDGYVHSGQIGFPGGSIESGEIQVEAALREADEEIGLNPDAVNVIGQLSPLPIPVSKFLVYPVVGIVNEEPEWDINRSEVQSIFTVSIDDIMNPGNINRETRQLASGLKIVPFFHLGGFKVWGATAMMLSEFKVVIETMR
ncbi:MAG: CoA pyrophosphatase [Candidatus Hatepunaea meridiana]|nr:CoA pyrophosphatase [Candidatus Hatepunaea meridiana]